jgi:hypothetical protein
MKTPVQIQLARILPLALLLSATPIVWAAPTDTRTILGTADQQAVEAQAITVFNSPAVKEQVAASRRLFLASPVAVSQGVEGEC